MDLHPLVAGFAGVADDYERGRPGYPPEVIAALALPPGARVADVGAGTGKLTRALLAAGFDVVAVEPLPGLRARLPERAERLEGTAEALPLPDASVGAVACADAYHWFDGPRAVAEFARVLRPGGRLALLWHDEDEEAARPPWQADLHALLEGLRPPHPGFTPDRGRGAVEASPAFGPLQAAEIRYAHPTNAAGIVAHVASMSWIGGMPGEERAAVLRDVERLLARHGVGAVEVPQRATLWLATRASA